MGDQDSDTFHIVDRDGVVIIAEWLTRSEIHSGDSGVLLRRGEEALVEGMGVVFHEPPGVVALFLPSRTKSDVESGDRLISTRRPAVSRHHLNLGHGQ